MKQSSINKYFFILGSHPALSVAEILAYLNTKKCQFSVTQAVKDCLIITTNNILSSDILQFIGGSIKFGQIEKSIFNQPTENDLIDLLPLTDKIFFGLSYYSDKLDRKNFPDLLRLGLGVKRMLKNKGKNCRLVTSRQTNLSAVVISKNKLLSTSGVEIVIVVAKQGYLLGKTLAVQPFEQLSQRDYGRPQRDDHSGLLPPKLAQIMLNLSQTIPDEQILDPFCGSGTILQEALWQGRQQIIGSDISTKAVADSKKNLAWLQSQYGLSLNEVKFFQSSVKELTRTIKLESIAAIVTEPDLGRPDISQKNLLTEKVRLEKLYLEAYQVFFKLLKKSGRVVMVWPVFFQDNFLDIEQQVEKIGFKKIRLLPTELLNIYKLNKRNNLQYARLGQKVAREITSWQKI